MGTMWGSQDWPLEEDSRLCRLLTATAGQAWTRERTREKPGRWKPVHLLARVDLWWIAAHSGEECPTIVTAWRKGCSIELARCRTVIKHKPGEAQWSVAFRGRCQEFKAESPTEATRWVSALRRRVCRWHEVLEDQAAGVPGNISQRDERRGPIRLAHVVAVQEMVKGCCAVGKFAKEILGTVPIAGPALSLLGFALELVHRGMVNVEKLRTAKLVLEEVATLTIETLYIALELKDSDYEYKLLRVLQMVELAARMLERRAYRSTARRIRKFLRNGRTVASAVLEVLKRCEQHLHSLKQHNIERMGMAGLQILKEWRQHREECGQASSSSFAHSSSEAATMESLPDRDASGDTASEDLSVCLGDDMVPLHLVVESGSTSSATLGPDGDACMDGDGKGDATLLHVAAENEHTSSVTLLLDRDACVSTEDDAARLHLGAVNRSTSTAMLLLDGNACVGREGDTTPRHLGAGNGNTSTAMLVLDRGVYFHSEDEDDTTPLCLVAENRNASTAMLLVSRDASVTSKESMAAISMTLDRISTTSVELFPGRRTSGSAAFPAVSDPMHWAAHGGRTATVELLLNRGICVNAVDAMGSTPIHWAARAGQISTVELLLDRSACVNAEDEIGSTPIHWAAEAGQTVTVELLLDRGACVNAADEYGQAVIHWAAQARQTTTMELLLDRGASVDTERKDGIKPLDLAAAHGRTTTVKLLLDRGASVNAVNKAGSTAVHWAADAGETTTLALLLDRGADVNAANETGSTAMHWAADDGQAATVALLLDRGADVNAVNEDGKTPLHRAASNGHTATVKLLLDRGACFNTVDQGGETPLIAAMTKGENDVVELLSKWRSQAFVADKLLADKKNCCP